MINFYNYLFSIFHILNLTKYTSVLSLFYIIMNHHFEQSKNKYFSLL